MMQKSSCRDHGISYNAEQTEGGKCPLCLSNNDFERQAFRKLKREIKAFKLFAPDIPDIPSFIPDQSKPSCQYCGRPVERCRTRRIYYTCFYCRRNKLREKAKSLKRKPFPKYIRNKNKKTYDGSQISGGI